MSYTDLPTLNACLNGISSICLLAGYVAVRRGQLDRHRSLMLGAVGASALFLASYLVYHAQVGSVPYPLHDWTRPLYFAVLVPHVILAALMVPFILAALYQAWRGRFDRHARLTRWVWPVWVFVSLSGIFIFAMLYLHAGASAAP